MSAAVVIATKELAADPAAAASTDVTVRNAGTVVDELTIEVLGVPAAYAVVEPGVVRLFPGTEQTVKVTFTPPKHFSTASGPQPFGVRATPHEDPAGSATDEGVLHVGTFDEAAGELVPRTISGRRSARTELAVDSRGNRPLDISVHGMDPNGAVKVEVDPSRFTAESGTATFLKVEVRPAHGFWRGNPRQLPFKVGIDHEGAAPVVVEGTMIQKPLLPKWLWKLLLALLLLLLLLFLLWHFLLQPKIKSEATDAANSAVAAKTPALLNQAKKAGGAAGKAAAGGGGGGGGGGAATTTTTTTPTTTTTTLPPPQAIDFRLAASTNPGATQLVTKDFKASKQDFSLTDIVLQNPAGDHGTLTLQRGTDPNDVILVINLDDFRDLDYHYVAPIEFDKKAVVLKVSCTGGGSVGGGTPAPTCTPAVSINGYVTGP